jgi:myxalamid-type polyketide synthase MxaC
VEADVSDRRSLKKMLEQIDRELPPLRGIIHAAGVVEMQFMTEMTMDMYDRVVAAKIEGGWNLHRATRERALDFLVFFSSVSTIIGTIQQSAYGAANAFLDGLAHYRRKLGLPATAINWGPWADVGMAAEHGADLASRGNFPLPAADALNLMGRLMREQRTQATVMMADWSKLVRAYDALRRSGDAPPMFNHFKGNKNDEEQALAEARALHAELMQMSPQQRQDVLQGYLAEQVAHIMGLEPIL